jgi:hypothetical protein
MKSVAKVGLSLAIAALAFTVSVNRRTVPAPAGSPDEISTQYNVSLMPETDAAVCFSVGTDSCLMICCDTNGNGQMNDCKRYGACG